MLSPEALDIANPETTALTRIELIVFTAGLGLCLFSMLFVRKLSRLLPTCPPGILRGGLVVFAASFLLVLLIGVTINSLTNTNQDAEAQIDLRRNLIQMVLVQGSVYAGALIVMARSFGKRELSSAGFTVNNPVLITVFSIAAYFTFYPVYFLCCLINNFLVQYEPQEIVRKILDDPELMTSPMVLLCAGLFIPILEEVMFRGFLLSGLREYLPRAPAIIISSIFFGCMHELHAALPVFALGCILGYVKERTGSLLSCTVVHALHNSAMLFFLPFL